MDITKFFMRKRPLELSADEDEVPLPKSPNQEQPQQRLNGKSSTHLQSKSLSKAANKLVYKSCLSYKNEWEKTSLGLLHRLFVYGKVLGGRQRQPEVLGLRKECLNGIMPLKC